MKVGDIRPANVVINPDGYLRVINAMSWPGEESAYTKAFEGQPTYLSPEDVHKMEMGGVEDRTNFNSEVFSIGLTVLSAGMLTDFASLYPSKSATSKSFQFDLEEGNHCLNEWKSNRIYS